MDKLNFESLYKGAKPIQFEFAQQMRKEPTQAESILWTYLSGKQMQGLKFRRQHPLDNFILDFYCHEIKLSSELDGKIHQNELQATSDKERTKYLQDAATARSRPREAPVTMDRARFMRTLDDDAPLASSPPMRQRSPFFLAALAGLAVLLAAFAPVAWQMWRGAPVPGGRPDAAPWHVRRSADGVVLAFGPRLPGATLADARRLWGAGLQLAVIAGRDRPAALEAYVERWSSDGLDGRLVLAAAADAEVLARWQQRSLRRERIDAVAERWTLQGDDADEALQRPLTGLSFLPAARVDAATLQARLGAPAVDPRARLRARHDDVPVADARADRVDARPRRDHHPRRCRRHPDRHLARARPRGGSVIAMINSVGFGMAA